MTKEQRHELFEAWAFCDWINKSTEFTIQHMMDSAKVDLETVIEFMENESGNRQQWYKKNKDWYKKYEVTK